MRAKNTHKLDEITRGTCMKCGEKVYTRSDGKKACSHVNWDGSRGVKCDGTGRYVVEVRKRNVDKYPLSGGEDNG